MTKKKEEVKTNPAGRNDKTKITYANFAANLQKTEMKIDGKEFDNDLLLRSLGFELDNKGTMRMNAIDNDFIRVEEKDNELKRIVNGKEVSSVIGADEAKIKRLIEAGNKKIKENSEIVIIDTPAIAKAAEKAKSKKSKNVGRDR